MLASFLKTDLDLFDTGIAVAVIIFLLCAVLSRPAPGSPIGRAWVPVMQFIGIAAFAFSFLWMTP